jgi:outer membrane receptor for ferrienterochelin and colicins
MPVNSRLVMRSLLLTGALALLPALLMAQGSLAGTVTDTLRSPLGSARVSAGGMATSTDEAGRYALRNLPAGVYEVRAQRIGHRAGRIANVRVRDGEETRLDITLTGIAIELAPQVVSVSRRPEKVTDAPATITRIESSEIENTAGNSFAPALKQVKGLDFLQIGMTSVAVNARGFNSAFNNRMLMMEDNRVAVLPENGLPVGGFTTIPKVDLDAVEVLVGPGSALYGPDASNGVITLSTKDPRDHPGTTIELTGGNRSYYDVQARHAGVAGRLGYKITGEYQAANDFENVNTYAPIAAGQPASPEVGADWNTNVGRGAAALVYYAPDGGRLELNGGLSQSNAIGITNVGRNQLVDWKYSHQQLRYSRPGWFAQAYHTQSLSGDTYQLNGFAQNRLRFPALSDDSVRALSDFPASGNLYAAELQNSFTLPTLHGLTVTWGGQYRRDQVSSKRQWLLDRLTGEDISFNQIGGYGQVELPVTRMLRLVGAGRYDKHDEYDAQFSPKAAILLSPLPEQTFRVSYNRAFKSPTVLQTSFFFPDFQPFVGVFGNSDGYEIRNADGDVVRTIDPIEPEVNTTWELGYKGILGRKLYLDVTGYRSSFDKFMSPLVIIANFLTPESAGGPTTAHNAVTGEQLTGATGGPQIPLTYFNVGKATIYGTDVGLRYLLTSTVALNGTMSWQKLDTVIANVGDPAEATAFNSPDFKLTLGADAISFLLPNLSAGLTFRAVDGYHFVSGVNVGRVPTFNSFDVRLGYDIPQYGMRVNLSVQNLFSCRKGVSTPDGWIAAGRPAIYTADSECGFGQKHAEMLNVPEVGTMVFLGIRYQR